MISGTVKSSIGMGMLLWSGIGDTIRVSLSADPVEEVRVGFDILKSLNLRHRGVNIVSCPSCARQGFNVIDTVKTLEDRLKHIATPMSLSIIGCVVNGPGEAKETDLAFTGGGAGKGHGMIYLNGKPAYKLGNEDLVEHVVELCEKKAAEIEAQRNGQALLKSRSKPRNSDASMIPAAKLERLLDRFAAIESEMASGASGPAFVKLSREHAELAPVIETARAYRNAQTELEGAEALIADPATDSEMRGMAEQERAELRDRLTALDQALKIQLLPRDAADDSSAIVEIRAGTGGDEAALFAGDLLGMYQRYCALQGWKTELLSL